NHIVVPSHQRDPWSLTLEYLLHEISPATLTVCLSSEIAPEILEEAKIQWYASHTKTSASVRYQSRHHERLTRRHRSLLSSPQFRGSCRVLRNTMKDTPFVAFGILLLPEAL
ncbi:hypothetical protein EJB05_00087, partial [Eragrostis curvula]